MVLISELNILLKQTVSKFANETKAMKIDLKEISNLLNIEISIVMMKVERMIQNNELSGALDKVKGFYYKNLFLAPEHAIKPPIKSDAGSNLPNPEKQEDLYASKQTEFVKAESREKSQEDLIDVVVKLGYVGSYIKVGVKILNTSTDFITGIMIKLIYSNELEVFQVKPNLDHNLLSQGVGVKIPRIDACSAGYANIYFKSESLGIGKISGQVQYITHDDYARFIPIDPMYYNLNPPKITPIEIPKETIQAFTKQEGIKKDIRSYGLPDTMKPQTAFKHIKDILGKSYNFQYLTEIMKEDQLITWFFGETDEGFDEEEQIMVVGQLVNRKIEFYASSFNEQLISSLLTGFSIDLKKRLVNSGVVESEKEIYDLYCSKCGGVLPRFPEPGEEIKCKWCESINHVR